MLVSMVFDFDSLIINITCILIVTKDSLFTSKGLVDRTCTYIIERNIRMISTHLHLERKTIKEW